MGALPNLGRSEDEVINGECSLENGLPLIEIDVGLNLIDERWVDPIEDKIVAQALSVWDGLQLFLSILIKSTNLTVHQFHELGSVLKE